MPYYCTVPRCTSMAGKAKNVSFHQFPRDEKLAKLWNEILKRGKPYTKYSKVCSLHFKPEDYTMTSVGKNKGQWRTLRKNAIPSQNLPSESPVPYNRSRNPVSWSQSSLQTNVLDSQLQQQVAQAIYVQTMLAIQAVSGLNVNSCNDTQQDNEDESTSTNKEPALDAAESATERKTEQNSFQCTECLKCFKDPDVFLLHSRIHTKHSIVSASEKENVNSNGEVRQEMLKANPILANLLQTVPRDNMFNTNALSIENHIVSLTSGLDYIRNLTAMRLNRDPDEIDSQDSAEEPDCDNVNSVDSDDSVVEDA
ncbi:uncharacterized protein ACR2FA_010772 [Aphomia sociella]